MAIKVKSGGSYADVQNVFVKQGGVYGAASVFAKVAGAYVSVGGGGGPTSLPLDSLTAAAAYSTRRLRTAYEGPLLRVRRSSDNTELDIGYGEDNWLDEAALASFVGSGSGFVTTWYDQSGNGFNVTQGGTGSQPTIVNSGTVVTKGGNPFLEFSSGDRFSRNSGIGLYSSGFASAFAVVTQDANGQGFIWEEGNNSDFTNYGAGVGSAGECAWGVDLSGMTTTLSANPPLVAGAVSSTPSILAWRDTGAQFECFSATSFGTPRTYSPRTTATRNIFGIGAVTRFGDVPFVGHLAEVILIPQNLDNAALNTTRIEQGSAYGVTVNPI